MTQKYILNGNVKKCKALPNGRYAYPKGESIPHLIDPYYEGFKIIFGYEQKINPHHLVIDSIEVVNPADGKVYTSRSKYYRSLKDSGNHIVERGEQGHKREIQGDFNVRKELKQAIEQHLGR